MRDVHPVDMLEQLTYESIIEIDIYRVEMSESDRHVEAVLSGLSLLDCFERDEGLRLEDFHTRTGMTRSRIIRLAGTLVHKGYLVHDKANSQYLLGPSLFRVGSLMADRYGSMASSVRPVLQELVRTTGLTAMFSVIGGSDRLVLAREEPDQAVRYTVREGQARPIVLGASGRVLLAYTNSAIAGDLVQKSKLTEADKRRLIDDLSKIRIKGFDVSESELTRHAFAVAIPVFSNAGDLLGVLTVAGPTLEYEKDRLNDLVQMLKQHAHTIPFAGLSVQSTQEKL